MSLLKKDVVRIGIEKVGTLPHKFLFYLNLKFFLIRLLFLK